MFRFSDASAAFCGLAFALFSALALSTTVAQAQQVTGKVDWGIWIDDDGCMHYWADGGLEGYMVPRRDPATGKPVCLKREPCLTVATSDVFKKNSSSLTDAGADRLRKFFADAGAFSYAAYVITDSSSLTIQQQRMASRRAEAVGALIGRVGQMSEGHGATSLRPGVDSGVDVAGDRLQIVCYRW